MDIREKTFLIIRRNGEYLVGWDYILERLKWSTSPWDAWRTRSKIHAQAIARVTGGILCLFNPIAAQIKEV